MTSHGRIRRLIFEFEVCAHEPDASFEMLQALAWAVGAGEEERPPGSTDLPIQARPRRMWLEGYEVETEVTFTEDEEQ